MGPAQQNCPAPEQAFLLTCTACWVFAGTQLGAKAGEQSLLLSVLTAGVDLPLRAWLALPNRGIYAGLSPYMPLHCSGSLHQCLLAFCLSQVKVSGDSPAPG